jgi:hypothetical protein
VADAAEHEAAHGGTGYTIRDIQMLFVVSNETTPMGHPAEGSLNGLITNDKFCLRRTGELHLSWPRARGRVRRAVVPQFPDEVTHLGGQHARAAATHLARSAHQRADTHRPAALGPGLSAPCAVDDDRTGAGRGTGVPHPAGGLPCE